MSDRPTITTLPSGGRYNTSTLNTNFTALRNYFDNVIGRAGTGGSNNTATNDLDMNTNDIRNVGALYDTSGNDILDNSSVGYAEEWAIKAEDNLVSVAAGGDGVTEYSALHWSAKAEDHKDAASTSATNAATSETNASNEASAAMPKYTFSTTTSMADPGAGILRYNNATVASVTAIAIDDTTADTGNPDIAAWITGWDDSTSTIKGQIRLVESGTPANYAVFNITGLTDNIGWVQLAVTHVDSNGTFSNTDSIRISYHRTGDKGDTGTTGATGATGPTGATGAAGSGSGDMNDIIDDLTPQLGGDLDANGHQVQWSKGADVASGTALPVLTDGNYFDVTGTTTITSINTTGGAGTLIKLHFDGALILTHHATNLVLPGAANITTAAGDEFEFMEYGAGTYRCTSWSLAGTAPGGGGGGGWLGETGYPNGDSSDIIRINEQTLNNSVTVVATDNASATGPLSIASGVTITVSSGATFVVI